MPDLKPTAEPGRSRYYTGLPAGLSLGGYELKSILGQGAFGITYRARHPDQNGDVAIKEYLPATLAVRQDRTTVIPRSDDLAEQFAWGRSRFLEEANTLKKLEGTPSIVSVHDFLEANGTAYMVMALIEGETLAKRLIREERLVSAVVEPLLFPLLDGLETVHAAGFLHRDIKPANIMVDLEGKPTLIDFGASRAALAGRSTTFTAIFTPGYAAAEQFASKKLGPWTDIYGLAATLYHAIAGKSPPSAIERVFTDEYQPLKELQPAGYSVGFLEGIDTALAVSSADRPQSVAEWRRMLASSLEATRIARSPGRIARVAIRTRRARLSIGAPAIGLAGVAGMALLGAVGYFVFTPNTPVPASPTVSTAALGLSAEELEQALAERRRADALAADKRRLEEEARQKAQSDADAKRQADAELEQARRARQQAEEELARLKAEVEAQRQKPADRQDQATASAQRATEEAQRKAEVEAAVLRKVEQEATEKAAAEAEAKRQADEALSKVEAERRQAEDAARAKAEAEQAALRQASEDAQRKAMETESVRQAEQARVKAEAESEKAQADRQKAEAEGKAKAEAETAEKALRLESADRQRLQVALTSLGFDTRGSDGVFGPRSREMLVGWQKARKEPPTGFLTATQRDQLLRAAALAVARWDEEQKKFEEQKKAEDEKKKTDATQAASTLNQASVGAATSPTPGSPVLRDGVYSGGLGIYARALNLEVAMRNGSGVGTVTSSTCGTGPMSLTVDASGTVTGQMKVLSGGSCSWTTAGITGRVDRGRLLLAVRGDHINNQPLGQATLTLGGSSGIAASVPLVLPSPDGLWRGTYSCGAALIAPVSNQAAFSIELLMHLANGSGTWRPSGGPSGYSGLTLDIRISVEGQTVNVIRSQVSGRAHLTGTFLGNTIAVSGWEQNPSRECTLALTRT